MKPKLRFPKMILGIIARGACSITFPATGTYSTGP
jgi:hypothetical protein